MDISKLSLQQRISAVAIVVVAISAFLPWVSVLGISALGIEGDGVITLLFAIGGAVVLALATGLVGGEKKIPAKVADIVLVALAAVVALIAIVDMNEFAAIGLYFTLLAGLAWAAAAGWQLYETLQADKTTTPPAQP